MNTTSTEYIYEAKRFAKEMGYIPSVTDFKLLKHYPNPINVKKEFKTWKNYIEQCKFPLGLEKKNNDTFYAGKHSWFSQDYFIDLQNKNLDVMHFLKDLNVKVQVDIIHKQMLFLFRYNDTNYAVSYLNIYDDDYGKKIKIIKECLEDMEVKLINLNGNYTWWRNQIKKELEIDDKHKT